MAETVAQIIQEVSTSPLNDQEPGFTYLRWPRDELLTYLNEALIEIGNYRPDAFMNTRTITLSTGSQQSINGIGTFLKSIDRMAGASLCAEAPITQCDLNLLRTFYKKPCLPTGGATEYRVRTYAYDPKNPLIFYVSPPVPSGIGTVQVVATVVRAADQYFTSTIDNNLAIDQKYYNAIRFWMAARAYEVDTESATSQAESDRFYKKFYNLLGVQYKQTSDFSGGRYLGVGSDHQMVKDRVP